MKINVSKTKIVVFRNGGAVKKTERWFLDGNPIEIVSFYKYLGVYFTPKMSWSVTLNKLSLQATKASNCILRYQKKFGNIPPTEMFKIFDSMVKPILCYASNIWGHKYNQKIESVHTKFCKKYCLLYNNCMDAFSLSECGRLPLCYYLLLQLDYAGRET